MQPTTSTLLSVAFPAWSAATTQCVPRCHLADPPYAVGLQLETAHYSPKQVSHEPCSTLPDTPILAAVQPNPPSHPLYAGARPRAVARPRSLQPHRPALRHHSEGTLLFHCAAQCLGRIPWSRARHRLHEAGTCAWDLHRSTSRLGHGLLVSQSGIPALSNSYRGPVIECISSRVSG